MLQALATVDTMIMAVCGNSWSPNRAKERLRRGGRAKVLSDLLAHSWPPLVSGTVSVPWCSATP